MKKLLIIILCLMMLLSLPACGKKTQAAPKPDNGGFLDNVPSEKPEAGENADTEPEAAPVPPAPDPTSDFYRATWISNRESGKSDTPDHYFGGTYNYLTASHEGSGTLVLGGVSRDFLWSRREDSISITMSDNGEVLKGQLLNEKILELIMPSLGEGTELTFIFIPPEEK